MVHQGSERGRETKVETQARALVHEPIRLFARVLEMGHGSDRFLGCAGEHDPVACRFELLGWDRHLVLAKAEKAAIGASADSICGQLPK
jgi:hypothetical protein